MQQLKRAVAELRKATAAMTDAVRADLPVGSAVSWKHGEHRQYGTVVDHGYSGRVMVENDKTRVRRWLTPYHFVDA